MPITRTTTRAMIKANSVVLSVVILMIRLQSVLPPLLVTSEPPEQKESAMSWLRVAWPSDNRSGLQRVTFASKPGSQIDDSGFPSCVLVSLRVEWPAGITRANENIPSPRLRVETRLKERLLWSTCLHLFFIKSRLRANAKRILNTR
jgi:hypothetical protein